MEILLPFFFPDGNGIGHRTQTVIGGRRSSVRSCTYLLWAGAVPVFQSISQQITLKP
jgi:hypothetical protein